MNPLAAYTDRERMAFHASVLLHDIGTPPFAHLLEYHLRERLPEGWNHEEMIDRIIWDNGAPENRAHQIFAGRSTEVRRVLKEDNLDASIVEDIVTGRHPLAKLLFGTIDFDNLDNVTRMAWGLGLLTTTEPILKIAENIGVSRDGRLSLRSAYRGDVRAWSELRMRVYQTLLFDRTAMAAQAALSEAIRIALDKEVISPQEWDRSDESLIDTLSQCPEAKELVTRDFLGVPPAHAFTVQIRGSLADLGCRTRGSATSLAESALRTVFGGKAVLPYAIVDNGTFEKELQFVDPDTGAVWTDGARTQSVIFYGFVRRVPRLRNNECRKAALELIRLANASDSDVLVNETSEEPTLDDQVMFDFSVA